MIEYMKSKIQYFSKVELILWLGSAAMILLSFCLFDRVHYITLAASLIGVTSLILNAKGNPLGQFFMILFCLFYGAISFSFAYYGEMLTYLGMSMPMAIFSLISWKRHPYNGNASEVKVSPISLGNQIFMWLSSVLVTAIFYFILKYFNTANIIPSTVSVTTSFIAAYLTFKRNPYYAIGYAANDIV